MRNDFCAGRRDQPAVATGVVAVFVRIENLRDGPVIGRRDSQTLVEIQWIDRKRLAGLRAGDQVVKVPVRVRGPDLLDFYGAVKP